MSQTPTPTQTPSPAPAPGSASSRTSVSKGQSQPRAAVSGLGVAVEMNSATAARPSSTTPRDPFAASRAESLRKAAILVVSLEQPLASQLLAHLDRSTVEAVTLEIARLDHVAPVEQQAVLEEFYGLGLRRLRFGFEDIVRMDDKDVREAFHDEDAGIWALALAGAARPVRLKVLAALTPSSARILRLALDRLGPFRLDDAESAQIELAERLRRLHDHGRLTLPIPDLHGQEVLLV